MKNSTARFFGGKKNIAKRFYPFWSCSFVSGKYTLKKDMGYCSLWERWARLHLQDVLWHGVEDVEQGLELEVLQVHRLQWRWLEEVARREVELGLWCRRLLRPRTRERCVQHLFRFGLVLIGSVGSVSYPTYVG